MLYFGSPNPSLLGIVTPIDFYKQFIGSPKVEGIDQEVRKQSLGMSQLITVWIRQIKENLGIHDDIDGLI